MSETNLILMSPSPAPNPTKVKQLPPPKSSPVDLRISSTTRRRSASLLLLLLPLSTLPCPSASAFSIGTSGPKEWLKDQKRKASRFILAPIQATRGSLQNASLLLSTGSQSNEEIRKLIGSASRDCVAGERSSIVAFQARTGVEVCTFRLLVKNAASLLDDSDPVKLETEAMLDELIRLFTSLGDLVNNRDLQLASDREKVEAGLRETISALDNFERGIRHCLDI